MPAIEGKRLISVSTSKTLAAAGDYAANDVLSEHATTGTCWTFDAIVRNNGGSGYITRAHAVWSKSGGMTNVTPRISILLFNATPTSVLNDNVASTAVLHADKTAYVGRIDFPAMSVIGTSGTASPESVCTPSTSGNLPMAFICDSADDALYGVVVILDAETNETAASQLTIKLIIEQY